jgi:SHS2 domain-containing protein
MALRARYEFFDHTADIGIRAEAATQAELFQQLAAALTELLVEQSALEPREVKPVRLNAEAVDELAYLWLRELLYTFSTDKFIPSRITFSTLTEQTLEAELAGDRFDLGRHAQGREVKAITRHLLQAGQENGVWRAQVIVDI